MNLPTTLSKHVGYGNAVILSRSDANDVALIEVPHNGNEEAAEALADALVERYEAPLIILGFSNNVRTDTLGVSRGPKSQVQWVVIHNGERKLMTKEEILDVQFALSFED